MAMGYRAPNRFLVCATCVVLGGCATLSERPPSSPPGFVVQLSWSGPADLDLHVKSPLGDEVHSWEPRTSSGGRLDGDCNARPESTCEDPSETIAWSTAAAPIGTYEARVRLVNLHSASTPVTFRVRVFCRQRLVVTHHGSLAALSEVSTVWRIHVAEPQVPSCTAGGRADDLAAGIGAVPQGLIYFIAASGNRVVAKASG